MYTSEPALKFACQTVIRISGHPNIVALAVATRRFGTVSDIPEFIMKHADELVKGNIKYPFYDFGILQKYS